MTSKTFLGLGALLIGCSTTGATPRATVTMHDEAGKTLQVCGASEADDLAVARTVCERPEPTNCQLGQAEKRNPTTPDAECCNYSCTSPADAGG